MGELNVKMDFDVPGRQTFSSLVCYDCGWTADAAQLSGAKWQARKHAEKDGCQEFHLEMVETRVVMARPTTPTSEEESDAD